MFVAVDLSSRGMVLMRERMAPIASLGSFFTSTEMDVLVFNNFIGVVLLPPGTGS
jgi:hypothetical protein